MPSPAMYAETIATVRPSNSYLGVSSQKAAGGGSLTNVSPIIAARPKAPDALTARTSAARDRRPSSTGASELRKVEPAEGLSNPLTSGR
jgi:hypothetical protein